MGTKRKRENSKCGAYRYPSCNYRLRRCAHVRKLFARSILLQQVANKIEIVEREREFKEKNDF